MVFLWVCSGYGKWWVFCMVVAYIDPGTGGIVLQMLVAAVIGVGVFFRQRIAALFRRKPAPSPPASPQRDENQST